MCSKFSCDNNNEITLTKKITISWENALALMYSVIKVIKKFIFLNKFNNGTIIFCYVMALNVKKLHTIDKLYNRHIFLLSENDQDVPNISSVG